MASNSTTRVSTALPIAEPAFKGVVGKTYKDSTSDFPQPVRPPEGAPNILLLLVDDLGFGGTSIFGGLVPTPNIDRLSLPRSYGGDCRRLKRQSHASAFSGCRFDPRFENYGAEHRAAINRPRPPTERRRRPLDLSEAFGSVTGTPNCFRHEGPHARTNHAGSRLLQSTLRAAGSLRGRRRRGAGTCSCGGRDPCWVTDDCGFRLVTGP